ncbi:MAG TPA: HAD family hydrolase [Blastocatellia bacterium]|nr:HAD family hydrolase [Blastocatellia bacterium]
MRYYALACDYDGTIATHGRVDENTLKALESVRSSGRKLILVTGRELDDLSQVFPHLALFDRVVAENGALLYRPATREQLPLGEPPPERFVQLLREKEVRPLSVGRVIVATWEPNETTVLEAIHTLGLELQVIFNKGAVMVLPAGVNKATGLSAALSELGLSPHNAVGVGDAENDHAFLSLCECSAAVANALPMLKERADFVTPSDHGAGVIELIEQLIESDLSGIEAALRRHEILLGTRKDGEEVRLKPYGESILIGGTSGGGKSTLAMGILERLAEKTYQFAIIDPEGDYESFAGAVVLGDSRRAPALKEIIELLENPAQNAVINLLGVGIENRPAYFEELLPQLQALRARTGRPHWIVLDETHHLLPSNWDPTALTVPTELRGMILITVHPDHVSPAVLSSVDIILAIGESPEKTIAGFAETLGQPPPAVAPVKLEPGEAVGWFRRTGMEPFWFRSIPPRADRRRHLRKYAEGELGEDKSFYFRGPNDALNLRAQNLFLFLQIADGVDDETWMHHLRQGDYSRWFREAIKDDRLADEAERIEAMPEVGPKESRALIRAAIEEIYTAPA